MSDRGAIRRVGASEWGSMTPDAKRRFVECYRPDFADWPGVDDELTREYIAWLDEAMPLGHMWYFVLEDADEILALLRVHDDAVSGAWLIEALETTEGNLRQGHAARLIRYLEGVADRPLVAEVHDTNIPSQRTLASCGFTLVGPASEPHARLWRYPTTA